MVSYIIVIFVIIIVSVCVIIVVVRDVLCDHLRVVWVVVTRHFNVNVDRVVVLLLGWTLCFPQQQQQQKSATTFITIEWRIRFKLATSTYKTLHTGHPPYLTDLLQYHKSSVSTRSSTNQLLAIPRHNLSFGSRSFRVSALRISSSSSTTVGSMPVGVWRNCYYRCPPLPI